MLTLESEGDPNVLPKVTPRTKGEILLPPGPLGAVPLRPGLTLRSLTPKASACETRSSAHSSPRRMVSYWGI